MTLANIQWMGRQSLVLDTVSSIGASPGESVLPLTDLKVATVASYDSTVQNICQSSTPRGQVQRFPVA